MLTGKFWLTPHGVIDVTTSEHEIYARRWLCKIPDAQACEFPSLCRIFTVPTEDEMAIFRGRKVDPEALALMAQEGADLRPYVMKKYGWVRVRAEAFWMHKLTTDTLDLCRLAAYWQTQAKAVDCDIAEIIVMEPARKKSKWNVSVKHLRGKGAWKGVLGAAE